MYSTLVLLQDCFPMVKQGSSVCKRAITGQKHTAAEETSETAKGYMSRSCTV